MGVQNTALHANDSWMHSTIFATSRRFTSSRSASPTASCGAFTKSSILCRTFHTSRTLVML